MILEETHISSCSVMDCTLMLQQLLYFQIDYGHPDASNESQQREPATA
jgi:hypothetical protein